MNDNDSARRNLRYAWGLVALFWALFGGTFVIALLYLQLD